MGSRGLLVELAAEEATAQISRFFATILYKAVQDPASSHPLLRFSFSLFFFFFLPFPNSFGPIQRHSNRKKKQRATVGPVTESSPPLTPNKSRPHLATQRSRIRTRREDRRRGHSREPQWRATSWPPALHTQGVARASLTVTLPKPAKAEGPEHIPAGGREGRRRRKVHIYLFF